MGKGMEEIGEMVQVKTTSTRFEKQIHENPLSPPKEKTNIHISTMTCVDEGEKWTENNAIKLMLNEI